MGIFSGCLLASDIDGTLLYNGVLPKKNIEAMEYFKSEGGLVCLATGRTASAVSPVTEIYNGFAPCVVGNGSMIYDTVNKKTVWETYIDASGFECIKAAQAAAPGLGIEVHCGDKVYTLKETAETKDHQDYEGMTSETVSFNDILSRTPNKILYLFDHEGQQAAVKEAIKAIGSPCAFYDTVVKIYGKTRIYLEQMPRGVSKVSGLMKLLDILNIKKENFFAVGDGYNDVEMLSAAAFSGCPAGAPDTVKERADIIVGDAVEGAVADFIYTLKRRVHTDGQTKKD